MTNLGEERRDDGIPHGSPEGAKDPLQDFDPPKRDSSEVFLIEVIFLLYLCSF